MRVADVDVARAERAATEHGIPAWGDGGELYADESVDIVVNLTLPVHHADTIITALEAGKHVYVEKPLATTVKDAGAVLAAAAASGRVLGSAPDTFLGSASQTARKAIDTGRIGTPIGASAFISHSKAETWHPDPRPRRLTDSRRLRSSGGGGLLEGAQAQGQSGVPGGVVVAYLHPGRVEQGPQDVLQPISLGLRVE